ncbi:hypothetical protein MTR67_007280 [Solanum verrucosum]|uniref:Integrase catalytic domain-containing protein n=1 Tax=Solanum verrucosum TaxID=315347 RepID=A0AAF0Q1S0_SOLVR|nr:hypothetical protein MTR67_007280 [Solanum verrucosum]
MCFTIRGKDNVVVDALSRLSMRIVANVEEQKKNLAKDVHWLARLGVCLTDTSYGGVNIIWWCDSSEWKVEVFSLGEDSVLCYQGRLCAPNVDFVAKCPNCQQVKVEHQKLGDKHDSIWVIVDRVTKSAHFLAVKTTDSVEDYTKLCINEIVRLHGVPLSIILDRGPVFTSHFWKSFQKGLGTQVNLSTVFHSQTDGQAERTIHTLEDMLRACVIDFNGSWDDHLPLIEFAYNNSYHSSIQIAPYEALYGYICRSPVGWFKVGETTLIRPDSVHEAMDKVQLIRDRLKIA